MQPYNANMARKLNRERPKYGQLLADLRKEVGLSQSELSSLVGVPQSNIAYWELGDKPPRSEVIPKLAKVLGVSTDTILFGTATKRKQSGPVGKTIKTFEEVSKLPRRQQGKIVEIVAALVNQFKLTHPPSESGDHK